MTFLWNAEQHGTSTKANNSIHSTEGPTTSTHSVTDTYHDRIVVGTRDTFSSIWKGTCKLPPTSPPIVPPTREPVSTSPRKIALSPTGEAFRSLLRLHLLRAEAALLPFFVFLAQFDCGGICFFYFPDIFNVRFIQIVFYSSCEAEQQVRSHHSTRDPPSVRAPPNSTCDLSTR
jgi:hypothetical protein